MTPRIGLVLSGGGARGAYEVGVLRYIREKLFKEIGYRARFDIYCGTSVGAINACYLAATALDPHQGIEALIDVWRSMNFAEIVNFGLKQMIHMPRLVLGGLPFYKDPEGRLGGLLSTAPLERLVTSRIPFAGISEGLKRGAFEAISITTTDVLTGETTLFIQRQDLSTPLWSRDQYVVTRPAVIRAEHALASAAIPVLFPAVAVDGRFYVDGGVRQNTPISPALRLGADRLLIIGLRHDAHSEKPQRALSNLSKFPGLPFIIGKILNALLLDHLDYDIDRLNRFNLLLEGGKEAYGPGFEDKINQVLSGKRRTRYRPIQTSIVRPSVDLGHIAAEHARSKKFTKKHKGLLARYLRFTALSEEAVDADLLSYLLFDADYCNDLIELGFRDAQMKHDDLLKLFNF